MATLKVPTKLVTDNFLLQDYKDDFNAINTEVVGNTNKIGNLSDNGITEASLALAVKNDRMQNSIIDCLKLKLIYGGIGDGISHPINSIYTSKTLAQIQVIYPSCTALTDEIDTLAIQKYIDSGTNVYIPQGTFIINKTIALSSKNFIGSGKGTIFSVINCTPFITPLDGDGRYICQISSFSCIGVNGTNYPCFMSSTHATTRVSSFKFDHILIANFGAGWYMKDMFGLTIQTCTLANCNNGIVLLGQVVQCTIFNVISNIDSSVPISNILGSDTKGYGIYIDGDSHSGVYQRPESIRATNCCFVNHDVGLFVGAILYGVFEMLDLDMCKQTGAIFDKIDGNATLKDSWVALNTNGLYNIDVKPGIPNVMKKLTIDNCSLSSSNGIQGDRIGIKLGNLVDAERRFGVTISNNYFMSFFDTAIYCNRASYVNISDNIIINPSVVRDIDMVYVKACVIKYNICTTIRNVSDGSYIDVISNHATTENLGTSVYKLV